jgi:hypothetical protein
MCPTSKQVDEQNIISYTLKGTRPEVPGGCGRNNQLPQSEKRHSTALVEIFLFDATVNIKNSR